MRQGFTPFLPAPSPGAAQFSSVSNISGTDVVVGIGTGAESSMRYTVSLLRYLLPDRTIKLLPHPPREENQTYIAHVVIGSIWTPSYHLRTMHNPIRILLSGEYTCPEFTPAEFDVAIAPRMIPPPTLNGITFIFIPYFVAHFVERTRHSPMDLILPSTFNATVVRKTKTKFCAFLYWSDVYHRNRFFDVLSKYKPVDALGRARGRGEHRKDRFLPEVFDNAVEASI